jgi:GntR family transcriptional regulator, N-acetylglucosamine utilization regulator
MDQSQLSAKLLTLEIDKKSAMPLYAQISGAISKLLQDGTLGPGAILPPERVFCERYGVSRMTLRQAFDALEHEGLIERHPGRGTFVAPNRMRKQQQRMRSFSEEIVARGGIPSSKLLSFRVIEPGVKAQEFFGLPAGEKVYEVERVRFSSGVAIALEKVQIPVHLCPNLDRFNLTEHSLYSILEGNYGLRLSRCSEEISAAAATRAQKEALNIPRGIPVLVVRRKAFTENETPVEMGLAVYRGDLYSAIVQSFRSAEDSQSVEDR